MSSRLIHSPADYRAMDLGNAICGELQRRGHKPTRLEVGAARIYISVDLMDADRPWEKAFFMDALTASPNGFEAQINAWKAKVRSQVRDGMPSKVVRDAIGHFGKEAVLDMLQAA